MRSRRSGSLVKPAGPPRSPCRCFYALWLPVQACWRLGCVWSHATPCVVYSPHGRHIRSNPHRWPTRPALTSCRDRRGCRAEGSPVRAAELPGQLLRQVQAQLDLPAAHGELDVLGARLRTYTVGVLVQNVSPLEDSWDFEGMTKAAHDHNLMIRAITKEIVARFPDLEVLPLGCGGCDFCEKCTCPDAPCRFPQEAMASVEAQGLDIKALVESVGLSYINGANTVSYVGMVMVRASRVGIMTGASMSQIRRWAQRSAMPSCRPWGWSTTTC